MITRQTVQKALLGRDVAVAYAVIVALYFGRVVGFQPLQIPAYLLIVAYDLVEVMLPALTPYYPVGFPLFLYSVAVLGAGAGRWMRSDTGDAASWTQTAGGVCLVSGLLAVLFGALVGGPLISPTDNPTPLAITGATGGVFLLGAWWMLSHRSVSSSNTA